MTLERIDGVWDKPPCMSPSHNPPSHIVLPSGVYRHTCPACGETTTFTVSRVTC